MNYLTYEEVCERAKKANNGPYEYIKRESGRYVLCCSKHGEFSLSHGSFYNGAGCQICDRENKTRRGVDKFERFSAMFLDRCRQAHGGRYDYSKAVYTGALEKVTIICRKHGDFEPVASNHLRGSGCPKCAVEARSLQATFRRDDEAYQERRAQALLTEPIYYVYMYRDPRPEKFGTPVYIGMGKGERMYDHLNKSHSRAMRAFITKVTRMGLPVAPELVRTGLLQAEAFDLERELIAKYRRRKDGGTLLNLTLGGEGPLAYVPSEETRLKISEASRKRMQDPEYKAKWLEKHREGCKKPEAIAKKAKATAAGWQNEETRRKRAEGIAAAKRTPEARARASAQQEAQWTSGAKKKASDFAKERLQDPVTKVRSSVANAYNWCRRQGRAYSEVSFPAL